ncbi:hypothetical protein [Elstera cyanobacteriorum]|uniref:hypothetical protein n=1 Tax=Elstera cyanobacteriorum TaxID=2022747 RepID=UPI0011407DB0|nr:hypothetical protein [Elstera cyanobacteriorum]
MKRESGIGGDRTALTENRETVFRVVKFAQLIKAMIDTPIFNKDGDLVLSTEKRVRDLEDAAKGIPLPA